VTRTAMGWTKTRTALGKKANKVKRQKRGR
jgi:hypothetical protein